MVQVTSDETEPILGRHGSDDAKTFGGCQFADDASQNVSSSTAADPLTIDNPAVALELFDTAVKIRNAHLARQCIASLNGHVREGNALQILVGIGGRRKNPDGDDFEPSAPPAVEIDDAVPEGWVAELVDGVRHNCLLEIDKHGDHVLKQKEIVDLGYEDLLAIVTRDTLQVSSELVVYSATMRWCMHECKRRTLQTQLINIKAVLRDLVYAPRYGLMTKREFLTRTVDGVKGPDRSGILDETETNRILEHIRRREKGRKRSATEELPYKGSQERKPGNLKPRVVSLDGQNGAKCDGACERALLNFLTCWTAVFD
ncbi:uncharacterized protein LOC132707505 isoform X2 [Cylas formicarius]|nr:uncharacterized protein LOC132707505 isoform X2 [Cylas formicarius]XP_060535375.1 uncharacterized protein LOC132707505 isoform X2 [Cylas formicarius]XP_060535376.1 uncharacterized protein LOC132707505 isoform X2 [Cylas formicarius]